MLRDEVKRLRERSHPSLRAAKEAQQRRLATPASPRQDLVRQGLHAWLLLGERQAAHDALCDAEITHWLASGVLSRTDRVYSRDGGPHRHVQQRLAAEAPRLRQWVGERFRAALYHDEWSPFCMIARSNAEADTVQEHFAKFCRRFPQVAFVRNDVYARLSHVDYNKGTALAEIARQLGITADHVLAAGDHLNDLPMLSRQFARWLVAPANAVPQVKAQVVAQEGYVSHQPFGHGVARGIELVLRGVR